MYSEDMNTIMLGDTNCNILNNSDNDTKHLKIKRILITYELTQLLIEVRSQTVSYWKRFFLISVKVSYTLVLQGDHIFEKLNSLSFL